jgi:hypothetical protein
MSSSSVLPVAKFQIIAPVPNGATPSVVRFTHGLSVENLQAEDLALQYADIINTDFQVAKPQKSSRYIRLDKLATATNRSITQALIDARNTGVPVFYFRDEPLEIDALFLPILFDRCQVSGPLNQLKHVFDGNRYFEIPNESLTLLIHFFNEKLSRSATFESSSPTPQIKRVRRHARGPRKKTKKAKDLLHERAFKLVQAPDAPVSLLKGDIINLTKLAQMLKKKYPDIKPEQKHLAALLSEEKETLNKRFRCRNRQTPRN